MGIRSSSLRTSSVRDSAGGCPRDLPRQRQGTTVQKVLRHPSVSRDDHRRQSPRLKVGRRNTRRFPAVERHRAADLKHLQPARTGEDHPGGGGGTVRLRVERRNLHPPGDRRRREDHGRVGHQCDHRRRKRHHQWGCGLCACLDSRTRRQILISSNPLTRSAPAWSDRRPYGERPRSSVAGTREVLARAGRMDVLCPEE
jgi:hypothetical protein